MLSENDYKKICEQLRLFGFTSYKEFIESRLWKEYRNTLYKKDHPKFCSVCGKASKMFNLHHTSYKRLLDPRLVQWVCLDCHSKVHKEIDQTIQDKTSGLMLELKGNKFERRQNSTKIIESSGLPAVLHHSIHASGLIERVNDGDNIEEIVRDYKERKEKIKDYILLGILNDNYQKVINYLENFYN